MKCYFEYKGVKFNKKETVEKILRREIMNKHVSGVSMESQPLASSHISEDNMNHMSTNIFHRTLAAIRQSKEEGNEKLSLADINNILEKEFDKYLEENKSSHPEKTDALLDHKDRILGIGDFNNTQSSAKRAIMQYFDALSSSTEANEQVALEDTASEESKDEETADTEASSESSDEESTAEASQNKSYDDSAQNVDVKGSLSKDIKMLFAGIFNTNTQERFTYHDPFMGLEDYIDPETVFIAMQEMMADAPNDMQSLKKRIDSKVASSPSYGFLNEVYRRLEAQPAYTQKQFLTKLALTAVNMNFIMYTIDERGNATVQRYDANSNSKATALRTSIAHSFRNSSLINIEPEQNFSVNLPQAKKFLAEFKEVETLVNELVEKSTMAALNGEEFEIPAKDVKRIKTLFNMAGLNLRNDTIIDLITGRNMSEDYNLNGVNMATMMSTSASKDTKDTKGNIAFGQIYKNVENAVQMSEGSEDKKVLFSFNPSKPTSKKVGDKTIKAGHFLFADNNNYLKTLLDLEQKHILTRNSNNYIEKPIYAFSPTNATKQAESEIKEGLKKFFGPGSEGQLEGKLKELSEMSITRQNFILQTLLAQRDAAESFGVSTISPQAIKARLKNGEYKSPDSGKGKITSLGERDWTMLTMGFFAHRNKALTDGVRMAHMVFPTLSDASDCWEINMPVQDFTSSNFDVNSFTGSVKPNRSVVDHLADQMFYSEISRIVDYTEACLSTKKGLNSLQNFSSSLITSSHELNSEPVKIEVLGENGESKNPKEFTTVPLITKIHSIIQEEFDKNESTAVDKQKEPEELKKIINDRIKSELDGVINDYASFMVENEKKKYFHKNPKTGNISGQWADTKMVKIVRHAELNGVKDAVTVESDSIDGVYLNSKISKDAKNLTPVQKTQAIEIAAYDYAVNSLVAQHNIQTMFAGDATNYEVKQDSKSAEDSSFSPDSETGLYNFSHLNEENIDQFRRDLKAVFDKMADNRSKRLKELISPGTNNSNSHDPVNSHYVQLYLDDIQHISPQAVQIFDIHYSGLSSKNKEQARKDITHIIEMQEQLFKDEAAGVDPTTIEKRKKVIDKAIKEQQKRFPKLGPFLSLESTDAQEYTTWREHLRVLIDRGGTVGGVEFTHDEISNIYKKLEDQENGDVSEKSELTAKEKDIVFQPMKPLHSGMYMDNEMEGFNNSVFVYVKSSSFPLLPSFTKGTELDNIRKNLEQMERAINKSGAHPGKNISVRASYNSANKVGARGQSVSVHNLSKNILTDGELLNMSKNQGRLLERKNFYIQQEKPYKADKNLKQGLDNLVSRSVQMTRTLFSNGIGREDTKRIFSNPILGPDKYTGKELAKMFDDLHKEEQDIQRRQLYDKYGLEDGKDFSNSPKTVEAIRKTLLDSSKVANAQLEDALQISYMVDMEDGNPPVKMTSAQYKKSGKQAVSASLKVPLAFSTSAQETETALNSTITSMLARLKMPGWASPVGSSAKFQRVNQEDANPEDMNDVVYLDDYSGGPLKYIQESDGKVTSEVLVPSKFRYKKLIGVDEVTGKSKYKEEYADFTDPKFWTQKNGMKVLNEDVLDPELKDAMSFRIPYSDHGSGVVIKVVGFLPKRCGDLMLVPSEHTAQIGEDYDIDIRTVYQYHHEGTEDKDGKVRIKPLKERAEKTDKEIAAMTSYEKKKYFAHKGKIIQNKILAIHKSIFSNPDPEIRKMVTKAIGTDLAENTVDKIEQGKEKNNNKTINTLNRVGDSMYSMLAQHDVMKSGATGKLGIGVHSLWVTFNGYLQQLEHPIKVNFDFPGSSPNITIGGLSSSPELGNILGIKSETNTPISISNANGINQNVSTDNQKLLYMAKRNENEHTISAFALLANLGYLNNTHPDGSDVDVSSYVIAQPIIAAFSAMKERNKDVTQQEFLSDEEIYAKLFKDLQNRTSKDLTMFSKGTIQPNKKVYTTPMDFKELTLAKLHDMAVGNDNITKPDMAEAQAKILHLFRTMSDKAAEVQKHQSALKLSSNGTGKSHLTTTYVKEHLRGVSDTENSLIGISQLYGTFEKADEGSVRLKGEEYKERKREVEKTGNLLISEEGETEVVLVPDKFIGHQMVSVIKAQDKITGSIFPFERKVVRSMIATMFRNSAVAQRIRTQQNRPVTFLDMYKPGRNMDTVYTFMRATREFIGTSRKSGLFKEEGVQAERRRLLYRSKSGPSLAEYLHSIKSNSLNLDESSDEFAQIQQMFNGPFFGDLEFTINSAGTPNVIKINAVGANTMYNENANRKIYNMYMNPKPLPAFGGQENYTTRDLAIDLAKYTVLAGNTKGAAGFEKLIPNEIFENEGHNEMLRHFDSMTQGNEKFDTFTRQVFGGKANILRDLVGYQSYANIFLPSGLDISMAPAEFKNKVLTVVDLINKDYGKEVLVVGEDGIVRKNVFHNSAIVKDIMVDQFLRHNPDQVPLLKGDTSKLAKTFSAHVVKTIYKVDPGYGNGDIEHSDPELSQITFSSTIAEEPDFPTENYFRMTDTTGNVAIFSYIGEDPRGNKIYNRVDKLGMTGSHEYLVSNGEVQSDIAENNKWRKNKVDVVSAGGAIPGRNSQENKTNLVEKLNNILKDPKAHKSSETVDFFVNLLEVDQKSSAFIESLRDLGFTDDILATTEFANFTDLKISGVKSTPNAVFISEGKTLKLADGQIHTGPKILLSQEYFSSTTVKDSQKARVLAEEVIHSATIGALAQYMDPSQKTLFGTKDIETFISPVPAPVAELIKLHKHATDDILKQIQTTFGLRNREEAVEKAADIMKNTNSSSFKEDKQIFNMLYRVSNMAEFVAGVVTDEKFRDRFQKVEYGDRKSFLSGVADAIANLFNMIHKFRNPGSTISVTEAGVLSIHKMMATSNTPNSSLSSQGGSGISANVMMNYENTNSEIEDFIKSIKSRQEGEHMRSTGGLNNIFIAELLKEDPSEFMKNYLNKIKKVC